MANGNFYEKLAGGFSEFLEKPFLTIPYGRTLSYREIDALAGEMAGALIEKGLKPGDRLVVQVEKSAENVALYLAAMRAGLVYVPLNTAYTAEEVEYFLSDAQPSIFVCDPAKAKDLASVAEKTGVNMVLTLDADGHGSLIDSAKSARPVNEVQPRHADDLAVILYTSGTTGRSKGAMLTHENLSSNAVALNQLWGFSSDDVLLHALPVFHIHGLFVALHTAMLSGCEILFLPRFDVAAVRSALPRASVMMGVPTFYSRLAAEPAFHQKDCAHMRLFISGSAPLTEEAFSAFESRSGHRILERYGMSEAGMIASNPLDGERVPGSVGYALPGVTVRITDEAGAGAPAGSPGGVEVKGPNVFKGYWRNPEKTAEEFTADGFFKTGDIGALSEDGRLTLMGRSKDLIIAGGYNIYPKEIEQVLDAIEGVAESAVIGVPHPDLGEGVVAVIVAERAFPDDTALADAVETLAKFKRPRKFFRVNELPRNTMGKVQKQQLRERFNEAYSPIN